MTLTKPTTSKPTRGGGLRLNFAYGRVRVSFSVGRFSVFARARRACFRCWFASANTLAINCVVVDSSIKKAATGPFKRCPVLAPFASS